LWRTQEGDDRQDGGLILSNQRACPRPPASSSLSSHVRTQPLTSSSYEPFFDIRPLLSRPLRQRRTEREGLNAWLRSLGRTRRQSRIDSPRVATTARGGPARSWLDGPRNTSPNGAFAAEGDRGEGEVVRGPVQLRYHTPDPDYGQSPSEKFPSELRERRAEPPSRRKRKCSCLHLPAPQTATHTHTHARALGGSVHGLNKCHAVGDSKNNLTLLFFKE